MYDAQLIILNADDFSRKVNENMPGWKVLRCWNKENWKLSQVLLTEKDEARPLTPFV